MQFKDQCWYFFLFHIAGKLMKHILDYFSVILKALNNTFYISTLKQIA